MDYGSKLVPATIYPYTRISFRNRITRCCLLPRMHAECDFLSSFSYIRKITAFQTLKNKINKLISLALFSPSSVTYEENQSGSSVTEWRCWMFIEKNLSGDRSPSTVDALVLYLRRTLIFFLKYFTLFIKNKIYNIEKNFLFA